MVSLIPCQRFCRSARPGQGRDQSEKSLLWGAVQKGFNRLAEKNLYNIFCVKSTMNFFRLVRAGGGGRLARPGYTTDWPRQLCAGAPHYKRDHLLLRRTDTQPRQLSGNLASTQTIAKIQLDSIWNIAPFCVWTIFRLEELTLRLCCCHWAPSQAFLLQYQHVLHCAVKRLHPKLGASRGWEGTAGSQLISGTVMESIPCRQTFLLH